MHRRTTPLLHQLMADTYLSLRIHLVWATKNRRPWLDPEWRPRLFACASNIVERKGGKLLCAGGARDHVHLYLEHPGTVPVSEIVTTIKTSTSRWVHQTFPHRKDFQWQHGYGAFTVTAYDDEPLKEFIRNQDLHHRERAYMGEILGLLERHGITYDAVHVLD